MAKRKEEIPEPESEDEADVMEFFESEEDALFAKELLEQYKRDNNEEGSDTYDNYGMPAAQRGGGVPMEPMDDIYGTRLTPRQVDTRFLLETKDDIPKDIKVSHWLLGSHHNELLNIQDLRQYAKYARENRDVVRTTGWQREHRKTAYSDVVQIEHYSNRLLTKSWKHGERLLQSTVIQRSQSEEVGERAPDADGNNASNVAGGLMGRLGRMFGR
jgi:hypothetical protein